MIKKIVYALIIGLIFNSISISYGESGLSGGGSGLISIPPGAGSGAPTTSTYITQTSDAGLSAEQALNALSDGLLKHASGVIDQAIAGTDYINPSGISGGQTIIGGTASGDDLLLSSTSDGTKGTIGLGSLTTGLVYDEVNVRLGMGIVPTTALHIDSNAADTVAITTFENTGGTIKVFISSATPEGVITGDIGDLCIIDTTSGEIFIKESGSGNTGWGEVGGGVASFSSMWYHGDELTTTISTASTFTKITSFENVGLEDAGSNLVGDATTDDDITINLAGAYSITVTSSFRNASGSNKNMKVVPKVILVAAKTITGATNATPIVMTVTAHGFLNGDMVTQSSVGGNTAANGDFFVSNKADNTYELKTLANVDVAGNGAYTSGGTVDAFYPGEIVIESVVSGTDLERGAATGRVNLAVGDIVELVVANTSDTNNFVLSQIAMDIGRIE